MKYQDFKNNWLGKSSSIGGYYNECVTLWKEFLKATGRYNNPERPIGGTGGAKEIWYRRDILGYGALFDYLQNMIPGDWCVWGSNSGYGGNYGHVAMFLKDNGDGTGQFLGMNQGKYWHEPANIVTLRYAGSLGALRYKYYDKQQQEPVQNITVLNGIPSDFHYERATFTANTKIKIRRAPSLKGQDTGFYYDKGMSVNYDGYVKREGYCWISWISAKDGTRRWMACGELNSAGYNTKPYGTFK